MAICSNCGLAVPDGTSFCPSCGSAIADQAAPGEQQYPQYPQAQYPPQYQQQNQRFVPPGYDAEDISKNRLLSAFAYLCSVFGAILLLVAQPESKYCRFHANQSLALFLLELMCAIVMIVPFLGWFVGGVGSVVCVVFEIIGIVNALKGNVKPLPIVGKWEILH